MLPPPLDAKQESEMIEKLGGAGDGRARASLIEHNLRLVVYIAKNLTIREWGWRI